MQYGGIEIPEAKLMEFNAGALFKGGHSEKQARDRMMCAMEWASYLVGEKHSAAPSCVAGTIRRFMIALNDRWSDERRARLKDYVLKSLGTDGSIALEIKRGFMAADWANRKVLPLVLDWVGLKEGANQLRALPPIVDEGTARAARDLARTLKEQLWSKYAYAADAAANAAAAYAAADAAAYAAAAVAAADAAAYAAADANAAYADAANAAYAAKLDQMALDFLEKLINVKE